LGRELQNHGSRRLGIRLSKPQRLRYRRLAEFWLVGGFFGRMATFFS
jgi:hypothetical protein